MNLVDAILLLIILICIYSGYLKGFMRGFIELLLLATSLLATFFLYPYIVAFFQKHWVSLGILTLPFSFILALIIVRLVLSYIASQMLSGISYAAHQSSANKVSGVIPGALNGLLWATIVAALMLSLPVSDKLSAKTKDSMLAGRLAQQIEWLNEKLSPVFNEAIKQTLNKLTIEPSSKKGLSLSFKAGSPPAREDLEANMLVLVNEERHKAGLKPLQADPEMQVVARAHSKDMFARGYFSHITPEGKSPFDRMKAYHVGFSTAGENLALGQTLSICHYGLMNSPGHRANILHPAFGRVGIGILDGGVYGLMITQNFRN